MVEAARGGSKEAFSLIVRHHQVQIRTFLSKFVQLDDVVDDLAQETFLAAYRSMTTYRGDSPLRTWLLGIARHRALRYLEDLDQRRSEGSVDLETALDTLLAQKMQREEQAVSSHARKVTALEACLENLPRTGARLIQEFYFKGRSAGDVAQMTGKTEGAVRITLMRLRQALTQCVQLKLKASEAV
ncbi:MAG TPA: sigma-70 family RNA polymerase sigma factor [Planctomycetota bacterium]|nr:sigma-70 family RNA polymerase sigma factor [Planctomycetota bacterium]